MPGKDIFWLGCSREAAPKAVSSHIKRIQFVDIQDEKARLPRAAPALVIVDSGVAAENAEHFLTTHDLKLGAADTAIYLRQPSDVDTAVKLINQRPISHLIDGEDDLSRQLPLLLAQHSLSRSRSEVESKVARIRGLIRFVKDLSMVLSLDELLRLLRTEIKHFHHVKDPLLATAGGTSSKIYYFQGAQVLNKFCDPQLNTQPSKKIRFNNKQDSQYLADLFKRPFAKLIAVPTGQAVLFFEHSFQEERLKEFIKFIEERLQPIAIAMDRLFLETDLKDASLLWERTFDGIQDPVAIFDLDGHLLRANRAFSEKLKGVEPTELHQDTVRVEESIFETLSYPIALNKGEEPTNVVNHYVDVTLSHKLQKQMVQNEKMAAIGNLAGHIAHELNNPLTGIRSLAQVLVPQAEKGSNTHNDLIEVEKAAERCQLIIKNLLEFSSGDVPRQTISLNEIVQRTLPLLKTAMSPFRQELLLSEDEILVDVEPQLMQQVFFNLVKNACQAMGDAGTLTIETRRSEDNTRAELIVADTGSGIPAGIKDHIFDFFFTTKSQGQGTGLGLSMSKSIVDRFDGDIVVDSEVGEGSRFSVRLPMVCE